MSNWTTEPQPFGANHVPLLSALSYVDGKTPVPVSVDPTTGALNVTSSNQTNGSQKTQIVDGSGNVVGTHTDTSGNIDLNVAIPHTTVTGNITSNQSITLTIGTSRTAVGIAVTGTWTGTLFFEATVDGTTWNTTTAAALGTGALISATGANGIWQANIGGLAGYRVRGNSVATGTAVVTIIGSAGTATVMLDNPLPTGSNTIGNVGTPSHSINVGQNTMTSGARLQLNGGTSITSTSGIIIQALSTNSASVYVGGSSVTTSTGYELQAGQAMPLTALNINLVYIIGSGSDGVCWNVL